VQGSRLAALVGEEAAQAFLAVLLEALRTAASIPTGRRKSGWMSTGRR